MKTYDCIVIGAGQTGLATGYKLRKAGLNFLIMEARSTITGSFGSYYDSLKLFTPVSFSQLPGLDMPFDKGHYPKRDEFIDYLQQYATHFKLPVVTNSAVISVEKEADGFLVKTDNETFKTTTLIDASGPYNHPEIPDYPGQSRFKGEVIHSYVYRNSKGFEGKRIVVVGAGNSALQIAVELKDIAEVTVATRRKIKWVSQRILGLDIHWWMHSFGIDHFPLKQKPKGGIPVIDIGGYRKALKRKEFNWKKMFAGFTESGVVWEDGKNEKIDVVIYGTGFKPKFNWMAKLSVLDENGNLIHRNGISPTHEGLFFAGQFLQRNAASGNVRGAAYDAEFIVRRVLHTLGKSNNTVKQDIRGVAWKQLRRQMV